MARESVAKLPGRGELKPLGCRLPDTQKSLVRGGELFEAARQGVGYSQEQAAAHMGVTSGTLSKQIDNTDNQHLSFNRICAMPAAFRRELALEMLADVSGADKPLRMFLEVPSVERKGA